MFEHLTQEILLDESLDMVSSDVDKREGAIIWDALSPHTIQLYEMYLAMDGMLSEMFGDTATREFLIRLARDRGIIPYPATHAILKGEFNIDVPIGSRFSLGTINYVVIERISFGEFQVQCETAGAIGNTQFGPIIPIEYIQGLTRAELVSLLIPGEDEEDTESLRTRYLDSFNALAFGGNRKDYQEKVNAIPGVGGVKVYRVRNDPYNVSVVIVDSTFNVPTPTLIDQVQTILDPVTNHGEGVGIAPIGHTVLVTGVGAETIDINFPIVQLDAGLDWLDVLPDIQAAIDAYFSTLRTNWESDSTVVVRIAQIESAVLDVNGVIDVQNTTLNGAPNNVFVDQNSIPLRGDVTNV